MKNNKKLFSAVFELTDGNTVKVVKAKKLVGINQHRRTWKADNSRDLARMLNKSNLVIN